MTKQRDDVNQDRRRFLKGAAFMGAAVSMGGLGLLAACGPSQSAGGKADNKPATGGGSGGGAAKDITVALVTSLTGTNAAWGQSTRKGFEMAVDLVNGSGGIKSKGGAKLVLKPYDTESKPDVAGTQAEKALSDGAVIITGCNQSPASLVASQVCERKKVPFLTGSDADPLITNRGFKYTFRTSPLINNYAADLVAAYAAAGKKAGKPPKSIAILCENSIVGQSAAKAYQAKAQELGINVVEMATYDASASNMDFTGYIGKYKAANADLLVGHNKPSDAINIVRTCKQLGYNPMAIGGAVGGHVVVDFINALGADADYVSGADGFSVYMKSDLLTSLNTQFKAKFNAGMDSNSAQGFSVTAVIADALERAKTLGGDDLRAALAETDLKPGDRNYIHTGGAKFQANGDNAKAESIIWQIKDKVWQPVWPETVAAMPFAFPKPAFK